MPSPPTPPLFALLLFDTSDFPARWHCGNWTTLHGVTHIVADGAIAGAYAMIPLALVSYLWLKRREVAFPRLFWLFAAFILSCGSTHLVEAIIFYTPVYRFSALLKVITAVVSWATVIALLRIAPAAMKLPGLARANEELRGQLTATREAEEALARSNEALESFTGLVTHDLRNPLHNAALSTELAHDALTRGDSSRAAILLKRAEDSLRQMTALVAELHRESMRHGSSQNREFLSLGSVVDSAKVHLAPVILESGAKIRVGSLPEVRGQRTMLVQLFINLFENAIKYCGEEDPVIEVSGRRGENGVVVVRVADNGPGIPVADRERIFEPGYRASSTAHQPGSGLGLAFCRRIMSAHGGEIRALESPGGGAVFELVFGA